jgi:hypothetical protein
VDLMTGPEQGRYWVGSCEFSDEPAGSIEGGEFTEQLSDYQLQKTDSDPLVRNGYSEINMYSECQMGVHGSGVVKALCYKPEGRGFDTR